MADALQVPTHYNGKVHHSTTKGLPCRPPPHPNPLLCALWHSGPARILGSGHDTAALPMSLLYDQSFLSMLSVATSGDIPVLKQQNEITGCPAFLWRHKGTFPPTSEV